MSQEPDQRDEFFVGYASRTPSGIARRVRAVVIGVVATGIVLCGLAAAAFRDTGRGVWSDQPQAFVGQLIEKPYPMLRMSPDGAAGRAECVLLVSTGKHGAAPRVTGFDGRVVSVWGTLLSRDGRRMVELADEPGVGRSGVVEPASASVPGGGLVRREVGRVVLAGEIVDPKCYLGAMKPGDGKAHKGCAILCISGGIPPMLVVSDPPQPSGSDSYYLLVDASGGPLNKRVLPFVAEPVVLTGVAEDWDGLRVLRVDDEPGALRRR